MFYKWHWRNQLNDQSLNDHNWPASQHGQQPTSDQHCFLPCSPLCALVYASFQTLLMQNNWIMIQTFLFRWLKWLSQRTSSTLFYFSENRNYSCNLFLCKNYSGHVMNTRIFLGLMSVKERYFTLKRQAPNSTE